jgi:hypothetical protein
MTAASLHSGNERWQVHCPDPHPDPGCWCYEDWLATRSELARVISPVIGRTLGNIYAEPLADRLLTAGTLRIELR